MVFWPISESPLVGLELSFGGSFVPFCGICQLIPLVIDKFDVKNSILAFLFGWDFYLVPNAFCPMDLSFYFLWKIVGLLSGDNNQLGRDR